MNCLIAFFKALELDNAPQITSEGVSERAHCFSQQRYR